MVALALVLLILGANGRSADEPAAVDSWALVPLKRPPVPATPAEYQKWISNPVDSFVLQKLLANGLAPSP
jgi:hypothetical protein